MNEQNFIRQLESAGVERLIQILNSPSADEERILRAYFGDNEYEALRGTTRGLRRRAGARGNVVVLHGIMAGQLTSVEPGGDSDVIWLSFRRILWGGLRRLHLDASGLAETDPRFAVSATGTLKRWYASLLLGLAANWKVHDFFYDWRKDMRIAADALRQSIDAWYGPDEPVHLVAHSMGGLVSRCYIRRHPDRWAAGGQLIMLGTPNHGSATIPRVLTGDEMLVWVAGVVDLWNSEEELLEVFNTFAGTYQMLPSPYALPGAERLYDVGAWGPLPVRAKWLKDAKKFHDTIAGVVDPDRMTYIAGYGERTFASVEVQAPGQFSYTTTSAGDGRVSHRLGILDGVPTHYVREVHGNLPSNREVIQAVDDLLTGGSCSLPRTMPDRGLAQEQPWFEDAAAGRLKAELRAVVRNTPRGAEGRYDEAERRIEEAIAGGFLGRTPDSILTPTETRTSRGPRPRLRVILVLGLIQEARADAMAVGHYIGVLPQAAEAALDQSLGGVISEYSRRGVLRGDLGRVFLLPALGGSLCAKHIAVAGMGHPGRFGAGELAFLSRELVWSLTRLGVRHLASVLIGSGDGNLEVEDALRNFLRGVAEALKESEARQLDTLSIVEADKDRFQQMAAALDVIRNSGYLANLIDISIEKATTEFRAARPAEQPSEKPLPQPARFHVTQAEDTFLFSAITESAAVPERRVQLDHKLVEQASAELMTERNEAGQRDKGYYLMRLVVPQDIRNNLHGSAPVVVMVDRSTARYSWEMMSLTRSGSGQFLGVDRYLCRQFQTEFAPLPERPEVPPQQLRVLVAGNPTGDLPGAEEEANTVARLFLEAGATVISLIGRAVTRTQVLRELILNEFDVLHYAGHCFFDEQAPDRCGWKFADGNLTARELSRVDAVPRLVFNNSCESGVTPYTTDGRKPALAPSFAEAFFAKGVGNIVCTGWPVNDEAANVFAETFYRELLDGERMWRALAEARRTVKDNPSHPADAWGTYQFYGSPYFRLVSAPVRKARTTVQVQPPRRREDQIVVKFKDDAASVTRLSRSLESARGSAPSNLLLQMFNAGDVSAVRPLFADPDPSVSRGGGRFAMGARRAEDPDPELAGLHFVELTRAETTDEILKDLRKDPSVEYAHRVAVRKLFPAAKSATPYRKQWGHFKVRLPEAQTAAAFPSEERRRGIVVAVVDSGIDPTHPDLAGFIREYRNFTHTTDEDTEGHGTHVAGIICARPNRKIGLAGIAGCSVIAVKGLSDPFDGPGYYQSLRYAADHAHIINLSLGGEEDPTEALLIRRALKKEVIVVAAMGNEFEEGNPIEYPAAIAGVIAVGASNERDRRGSFSNTGKHITLVAPGVDILSTLPGKKYDRWDGTSMATPYVSAALALLLARGQKKLTAEAARRRLLASLDRGPLKGKKFNVELGYGRLNIEKLLE